MEINYRITTTSVDWERTLSELGVTLQNVGDGMAVAGYGLTLSVVGAEIGVPLAAVGNGISLGGSLLESAATLNGLQAGTSMTAEGISIGTKMALRKTGMSYLSQQIIRQNVDLKVNGINNLINN